MLQKVLNILKKEEPIKKIEWVQHRCPSCNALLFEKNEEFKENTIRIKCRLCKSIAVH